MIRLFDYMNWFIHMYWCLFFLRLHLDCFNLVFLSKQATCLLQLCLDLLIKSLFFMLLKKDKLKME